MKYETKSVAGRPPSSRGYHGALHFDNRVFLLGGFDGIQAFSDVWLLDLASQSYLNLVSDFIMDADAEEDTADEDGTEGGYDI